jgi:hypothetical protein
MLDRLRHKGFGVIIKLNNGKIMVIPAFAFVDDAYLLQELVNNNDNTSPQLIVSEWEEALISTGGTLVPEKSSYAIVKYIWETNEWKTVKGLDSKTKIEIKDEKGLNKEIKQINNQKGELALGIMFSPTNKTEDERTYLREKTNKWADQVRTGHLKKHDAWLCLQTTIMRTIEYALPATTLTKQQLDHTQDFRNPEFVGN